MDEALLHRIAEALERLAPASPAHMTIAETSFWNGQTLSPIVQFSAHPLELLTGIDQQKQSLLENTLRLAKGFSAHDVLLWGARGSGKSALVKAVVHAVRKDGCSLDLVQVSGADITTLPDVFRHRKERESPAIIFVDDLGFERTDESARNMRSLLDGGVVARPPNVRLYVTTNQRNIVPRDMQQQASAINARDVADDQLALADRFGLSLGFHICTQEQYLTMVSGYATHFGLPLDQQAALTWATQRGARSGRAAWHYITELAGAHGKSIA